MLVTGEGLGCKLTSMSRFKRSLQTNYFYLQFIFYGYIKQLENI